MLCLVKKPTSFEYNNVTFMPLAVFYREDDWRSKLDHSTVNSTVSVVNDFDYKEFRQAAKSVGQNVDYYVCGDMVVTPFEDGLKQVCWVELQQKYKKQGAFEEAEVVNNRVYY